MEINVQSQEAHHDDDEQTLPLLKNIPSPDIILRNTVQQAINKTFKSTANLANLLPTGTVMAFQLLSPVFTNEGSCDSVSKSMTAVIIGLFGLSSFLLSFTDTFKDSNGNVCHGFATSNGLWVMDGSATIPPEMAPKYRLKVIDFVHAFMSVLIFAAVALFDKNTVQCFYPSPSIDAQQILTALPVGIGVFCSMLFLAFPTQRHGIGFPLTAT